MNGCDSHRQELGAHVLGGLERDESETLSAHLQRCPRCRGEREMLSSTLPLLALARSTPPSAPDRVRDRVVSAAARRRDRRRDRRRWLAGAAAAVLVAALLGGMAGWQLAPPPGPALAVPLESVEPFGASGWVTFREVREGVEVEVQLEGLEPTAEPAVYEAWLYDTDRRIVSIGQLEPVGDRVTVSLSAAGSLDGFRSFWVTEEPDRRDPAHDGPTVVRAPVPQTR